MLADKGKCKVWSHEESQVAHKRYHLKLIWFDFTNASSLSAQNAENQVDHKGDHLGLSFQHRIKLRMLMIGWAQSLFCLAFFVKVFCFKIVFHCILVCLRPGGGVIPQAVGLQGPDFVAHNNMRRGDRGNTCSIFKYAVVLCVVQD